MSANGGIDQLPLLQGVTNSQHVAVTIKMATSISEAKKGRRPVGMARLRKNVIGFFQPLNSQTEEKKNWVN